MQSDQAKAIWFKPSVQGPNKFDNARNIAHTPIITSSKLQDFNSFQKVSAGH